MGKSSWFSLSTEQDSLRCINSSQHETLIEALRKSPCESRPHPLKGTNHSHTYRVAIFGDGEEGRFLAEALSYYNQNVTLLSRNPLPDLKDQFTLIPYQSNFFRCSTISCFVQNANWTETQRVFPDSTDVLITFQPNIAAWLIADLKRIPTLHLGPMPSRLEDDTLFFLKYNEMRMEHGLKPVRTINQIFTRGIYRPSINDPLLPPCIPCSKNLPSLKNVIVVDAALRATDAASRQALRYIFQSISLARRSVQEPFDVVLLSPVQDAVLPSFAHVLHNTTIWDHYASYNIKMVLQDCRRTKKRLPRSMCIDLRDKESPVSKFASRMIKFMNEEPVPMYSNGSLQVHEIVARLAALRETNYTTWADSTKMQLDIDTAFGITPDLIETQGHVSVAFSCVILILLGLYLLLLRDVVPKRRRTFRNWHESLSFEHIFDEFLHRLREVDETLNLWGAWWTDITDSAEAKAAEEQRHRRKVSKKKHTS